MYGKDSIYARQPSPETIASIKTDDVRNFLQEWERPDNSVLGVLGDFDTQLMLTELQEVLGGWQAAPGQPEKPPQVCRGLKERSCKGYISEALLLLEGLAEDRSPEEAMEDEPVRTGREDVQLPTDPLAPASQLAGKVFLLDRPGATQASVFAAEPGVALDDPDATSLDVLGVVLCSRWVSMPCNEEHGVLDLSVQKVEVVPYLSCYEKKFGNLRQIKGKKRRKSMLHQPSLAWPSGMLSSFGGALFDQLRSREGLAYSVSGGWQSPPGHPGLFIAQAETSQPGACLCGPCAYEILQVELTNPKAAGHPSTTQPSLRRLQDFFAPEHTTSVPPLSPFYLLPIATQAHY
eukprot:1150102-Pelagomonas_calceolata.AAC.2